jgi:hypothetical protein
LEFLPREETIAGTITKIKKARKRVYQNAHFDTPSLFKEAIYAITINAFAMKRMRSSTT